MNDILREHLDLTAVGILDDVIIFFEDPALHVQHVRSILQILRENQLYAKVEKCEFNKDHMTFVGYMVSRFGIGMDPAKVSAVLNWPVPKSVKDVQSFLGFAIFLSEIHSSLLFSYYPSYHSDPQGCEVYLVREGKCNLPRAPVRLHFCPHPSTFPARALPNH